MSERPTVLVLNPNIVLAPVEKYASDDQIRMNGQIGDVVLFEKRARWAAQRLDAETAAFLEWFKAPSSIVEAVVKHSAATGEEPAKLLDAVYPLISQFRSQRILVEPGSVRETRDEPRFAAGDLVGSYTIIKSLSVDSETELYVVRASSGEDAVMKWAPVTAGAAILDGLRQEKQMLGALGVSGTDGVPRLLDASASEDGAFLVITWFDDDHLLDIARSGLSLERRVNAASSLARAYARLHAQGVMHGDIHPRNVLISNEDEVTLIDFGSSVAMADQHAQSRAALLCECEPEAVKVLEAADQIPPSTPAGEQYCVANLVFRLVTGAPPLLLSLERARALVEIATQPPRAFAEFEINWPEGEAVLNRALSKRPEQRFASMADFADALDAAIVAFRPGKRRREAVAAHAVEDFADAYGLNGRVIEEGVRQAPTASVYNGAGGIAYALLRAALLRNDAQTLAAAEVWVTQARNDRRRESAFGSAEIGLEATPAVVRSLLSGTGGLAVVEALIASAHKDEPTLVAATRRFLVATRYFRDRRAKGDDILDVVGGGAGLLIGASRLRALVREGLPQRAALQSAGDELAAAIEVALDQQAKTTSSYVGLAHGEAGAVTALMAWDGAAEALHPRLERLARTATADGVGLKWPARRGAATPIYWTGWCHGTAGHALLWSRAARHLGNERYAALAHQACESVWQTRGAGGRSICCGAAGQALVLAEAARELGEPRWAERARAILDQLPDQPNAKEGHSLFRGELGVSLAKLELEFAPHAAFPLC